MMNGQDPYFMFRNLVPYLIEMNTVVKRLKIFKGSIILEKQNTDESLNNFQLLFWFFLNNSIVKIIILINNFEISELLHVPVLLIH